MPDDGGRLLRSMRVGADASRPARISSLKGTEPMLSRMHTMLFVTVFVAFGWAGLALGQQKPEELAQQSSEAWLTLIDRGQFADSYQEAAQYFKNAVTKDQWQNSLTAVRKPLGKVLSRKLKNTTYTRTLPGAPDGDYVVIQYESSFEHKASAVETVTPMLDNDGKWRVSGYFIK
jgi:Protein of unknown function (DUF4019)